VVYNKAVYEAIFKLIKYTVFKLINNEKEKLTPCEKTLGGI